MRLDDALRERGFRRWYERQLVESHAYLVTGFLALIMMAIALETIEFRESSANLLMLGLVAAIGGWLCVFAWKQFNRLLFRAEVLAGQAVCPECRAYARFEILEAHDSESALTGREMTVRCRCCEHEWLMG